VTQPNENSDHGVSVWVPVAVVVAVIALLAYPMWWVLDSLLSNEESEVVAVPTTEPTPSTEAISRPVNLALGKTVTGSGPGSDPPGLMVDGNPDTLWNSGSYAPQLVVVDLEASSTIHSVRLLTGQSPNGDTEHALVGWPVGESDPTVLHMFEGFTTDRQWLTYTPDAPWEGIDRIGVGTTTSPSWVAWFEIQVMGTVP
jgi:hypothetical protein